MANHWHWKITITCDRKITLTLITIRQHWFTLIFYVNFSVKIIRSKNFQALEILLHQTPFKRFFVIASWTAASFEDGISSATGNWHRNSPRCSHNWITEVSATLLHYKVHYFLLMRLSGACRWISNLFNDTKPFLESQTNGLLGLELVLFPCLQVTTVKAIRIINTTQQ